MVVARVIQFWYEVIVGDCCQMVVRVIVAVVYEVVKLAVSIQQMVLLQQYHYHNIYNAPAHPCDSAQLVLGSDSLTVPTPTARFHFHTRDNLPFRMSSTLLCPFLLMGRDESPMHGHPYSIAISTYHHPLRQTLPGASVEFLLVFLEFEGLVFYVLHLLDLVSNLLLSLSERSMENLAVPSAKATSTPHYLSDEQVVFGLLVRALHFVDFLLAKPVVVRSQALVQVLI